MQYIKSTLILFCLFSCNLYGDISESLYSLNTQLESIANAIKKPSKNKELPLPTPKQKPAFLEEIREGVTLQKTPPPEKTGQEKTRQRKKSKKQIAFEEKAAEKEEFQTFMKKRRAAVVGKQEGDEDDWDDEEDD